MLRTAEAGLTPAVNMDTGYVHFLDDRTRLEILDQTRLALQGRPFLAGAFVADQPGRRRHSVSRRSTLLISMIDSGSLMASKVYSSARH